jgi:predicted RNase H-like HicB family nuclease
MRCQSGTGGARITGIDNHTRITYTATFLQRDDEWIHAQVVELPEVTGLGQTFEEARKNLAVALEAAHEAVLYVGGSIARSGDVVVAPVTVPVPATRARE